MKTISFEHKLKSGEIEILKNLVGKRICYIGAKAVDIDPFNHQEYSFSNDLEIANWENDDRIVLNFNYDQTFCLDDFIELRITTKSESKMVSNPNAQLSFSGPSTFTLDKIQVFGVNSKYKTQSLAYDQLDIKLLTNDEYIEEVSEENIILLHSINGDRIWIEYDYMTGVMVTLDANDIEERIAYREKEFNCEMVLKHDIT